MRGLVFRVTILFACATASAAPREFFVAADGRDAQPGTKERAFATIHRAIVAVRALNGTAPPRDPVTVYLRGGTYELTEKISFGPEDTGSADAPITYASYPGERAVLSGGRKIEGKWRKSPGKPYYELLVPEAKGCKWGFNSLCVNGMSRTRARKPNCGEKVLRAEGRAPGENERCAFVYLPGDIDPTWTNLTDADVVLLCSWTPTIHRIEEVIAGRRIVKFKSSHGRSVDFWEKNFRYYVANVLEELDTPGEWYLNRHTGVLYYYPLPGEDLDTVEVVAPLLITRMMDFTGDVEAGRFVEHLRFRDLSFRHVDGDLDRYNGVYRQGHMYLSAAIYAEGLRHSTFTNCELAQMGEYALEMTTGCRNIRIERCHIWDIGAGAMQIGITHLGALLAGQHQIRPGDIVLEAEDAALTAPMIVEQDKTASEGKYVVLPKGLEGGQAEFSVRIEEAGAYGMFAMVIAPSGNADSFVVQINDGPKYTYDTGVNTRWFMSPVRVRELDGTALVAELQKGANTIALAGREPGAKLDQLILRRKTEDGPADKQQQERQVLSNVIDNNYIHRLGTIWHGCYGIVNRFASLTQITHNEITDIHWDAIGLDARWTYKGEKYSHGNVVAYNHLHHLGLRYHTDAGGVYQFGPLDTHIHHNLIHDTRAYPYICGYGGVYLDEQSRGALVENNLVYNVDWFAYFQHKGMDNVFRNNIGAFARDGLILRGGLNERWKANYMEAYRNIYISDDPVAIRREWKPGLKPPVLRENMYFCTTGDPTFAGLPLAEWQAKGHDQDSVVGDPGCRAPAEFGFSLTPDAPAVKAIGFIPFDAEIRKAGLYGDPAWRRRPEKYPPRTPSPVWTPDDLLRFISFSLDFEDLPDGHELGRFRLAKEGDATFAVTSEVACTGKKSCRCVDRKGLKKPFYPYIHIAPRGLTKGGIVFSFDAMLSKTAPCHFYVEFRGKGSVNDVGPSIHFNANGTIVANGQPLLTVQPGAWCHIDIRFELGESTPREYALITAHNGTQREHKIPFTHASFSEIRWLGFSACDDADGVFYLDGLTLKID